MKNERNETPDRAMRIFRIGGAIGTTLVIVNGVAGPLVAPYLPFPLLLGDGLAHLGVVMGGSYCVAELAQCTRKSA